MKDLGLEEGWFHVWPCEPIVEGSSLLVEGYPSLFWRQIIGVKKRDVKKLTEFLEAQDRHTDDPHSLDDADACMLVLGGEALLATKYFDQIPFPIMVQEGWIRRNRPSKSAHFGLRKFSSMKLAVLFSVAHGDAALS